MYQITTVALRTAPNLNTMAAGMITNVLVCLHSFARNNLKGINPRKKTTTTTTKKKAKHSGLLWRGCFKCLLFVFKKSSGYIKVILRGVVSKLERRGYYYYFFYIIFLCRSEGGDVVCQMFPLKQLVMYLVIN